MTLCNGKCVVTEEVTKTKKLPDTVVTFKTDHSLKFAGVTLLIVSDDPLDTHPIYFPGQHRVYTIQEAAAVASAILHIVQVHCCDTLIDIHAAMTTREALMNFAKRPTMPF